MRTEIRKNENRNEKKWEPKWENENRNEKTSSGLNPGFKPQTLNPTSQPASHPVSQQAGFKICSHFSHFGSHFFLTVVLIVSHFGLSFLNKTKGNELKFEKMRKWKRSNGSETTNGIKWKWNEKKWERKWEKWEQNEKNRAGLSPKP